MKKLIILICLLFLTSLSLAQHGPIMTLSDSSGTNIYIAGNAQTVTEIFIMKPYESFNFAVWDTTSGGDSSAVRFIAQKCTDYLILEDWVNEDSLDVESDSTWTAWIYTSKSRNNFPYFRFLVKGITGNRVLASTRSIIRRSAWQYK